MPAKDAVLPLEQLPPEMAQRIRAEAAAPTKPPQYRSIGAPGPGKPLALIPNRAWWEWHWLRGLDPDRIRRNLPAHLRAFVIARDGLTCGLCHGPVAPDDVHIDHIHPVHLGGTDDPANLQVSHSACNFKKGARV